MNNRYENISITKRKALADQYYVNNIYPDILPNEQDNYIITTLGDRLDLLAFDFYGDTDLWWIIASANSLPGDSLTPEPGTQLRIPTDIRSILNSYNETNSVR